MFQVHVHFPLPTQQQPKGAHSAESKLQTEHILTHTHTKRMQQEIKKKKTVPPHVLLVHWELKVINNYKKETETERHKQRQRQRERSEHGKKGRREKRGANVTGAKTQN